ncbi:hypothetical protein FRB91_009657 [Serendipita sp. 411]|nr:hypothetical protein FRB91_009657 [Serendipita sp. 411]
MEHVKLGYGKRRAGILTKRLRRDIVGSHSLDYYHIRFDEDLHLDDSSAFSGEFPGPLFGVAYRSQDLTCLCDSTIPLEVSNCIYNACGEYPSIYMTCDENNEEPAPETSTSTLPTPSIQPSDSGSDPMGLNRTQTIATIAGTVFAGISALMVIWQCIRRRGS